MLNVTLHVGPVPEAPELPLHTGQPAGQPEPFGVGTAWKLTE
ncbi:MAG TPA: hypothetical protein VH575_10330 [Gemmataceae bacterium]